MVQVELFRIDQASPFCFYSYQKLDGGRPVNKATHKFPVSMWYPFTSSSCFYKFPMPLGLYCAEEVQRSMKTLNGKCQNKRTEEEKPQGSTEKSLETE